jgi:hypothetical protein
MRLISPASLPNIIHKIKKLYTQVSRDTLLAIGAASPVLVKQIESLAALRVE